ncbi:uncharacterized protein BXIN_2852 [Babesia sp. Xinjiang]|uniref:uncharacterized protein n=1 Tax=Babesia sp. Xinjiang TaxID=462227 RepID=UPI000A22DBC0|nr:uncharacterized protein BXIN_2852 [Babesia sp. Xinjiang]ORM39501.1 hypothetical protein BXIN_2852 [Babesia sp. Xinjiang]
MQRNKPLADASEDANGLRWLRRDLDDLAGSRSTRLSMQASQDGTSTSTIRYSTQCVHRSVQKPVDETNVRLHGTNLNGNPGYSPGIRQRTSSDKFPRIPTLNLALLDNRDSLPLSSLGEDDQDPPPQLQQVPRNNEDIVAQLNRIQTQLERKLSTVRLQYQAGLSNTVIKGSDRKRTARMISMRTGDSFSIDSASSINMPDGLSSALLRAHTDLVRAAGAQQYKKNGIDAGIRTPSAHRNVQIRGNLIPSHFVAPMWDNLVETSSMGEKTTDSNYTHEHVGNRGLTIQSRPEISIAGLTRVPKLSSNSVDTAITAMTPKNRYYGHKYDEHRVAGVLKHELVKPNPTDGAVTIDVSPKSVKSADGNGFIDRHVANAYQFVEGLVNGNVKVDTSASGVVHCETKDVDANAGDHNIGENKRLGLQRHAFNPLGEIEAKNKLQNAMQRTTDKYVKDDESECYKVVSVSASDVEEVSKLYGSTHGDAAADGRFTIESNIVERNIDGTALTHLPTISGNQVKAVAEYSLEYLNELSKVNSKCALLRHREVDPITDSGSNLRKSSVKPWFRNPLVEKTWRERATTSKYDSFISNSDNAKLKVDNVPDTDLRHHMEHIATYRLDLEEQERHNVLDPFYEYERAKQNKVLNNTDWAKYGRPKGRN